MATYYWTNYGEMPGQWEHQANWSLSEGGSSAGSYPGSGDTVIIPNGYGEITSLSTAPELVGQYVTIAKLVVNSSYGLNPGYDPGSGYGIYMYITCDTALFQGNDSYVAQRVTIWGGDCVFSGQNSTNYGNVDGSQTIFSGAQSRNYGYVSGKCEFSGYQSSNSSGTVYGPATFSGNGSNNNASCNSYAKFNGGSYNGNSGYIQGPATFVDGAYNLGYINADCFFLASSYNQGTISNGSHCYFGYGSYNSNFGTITGIATFFGYGSYNAGTINGVAVFSGSVLNTGTINGSLLAFTSNSPPAGTRYPLDVLGAGI